MTDLRKRNTLKAVSAATAVAMAPAIATAAGLSSQQGAIALETSPPTDVGSSSGIEISFSQPVGSTRQTLTLSNLSPYTISLKHVKPGMVKSHGEVFDINALLADGPITVHPGESGTFAMSAVAPGTHERRTPPGRIDSQSVAVSTRIDTCSGEKTVTTQRMCIA